MIMILRSILRHIRWAAAALRGPTIIQRGRIHGMDKLTGLHHTSHISVWPESETSTARVWFGPGVFIGKDVEIAAYGPGTVEIGRDTSFQDRCQIYGDIHIGAHCIFARDILVISTQHRFRDVPTWLIRDQDIMYANQCVAQSKSPGRKVWIEDDCWLGWGCTVMPGVYIGRSAIIGANSVVTSDIGPYEIHGGIPNAKIGLRLDFEPPATLTTVDTHLPYFYRGFRLRQSELTQTRARGYIAAENHAVIVLAASDAPVLHLSGKRLTAGGVLHLCISMNGRNCGIYTLNDEEIELAIPLMPQSPEAEPVPSPLRPYTFVELQVIAETANADPLYGISSAQLSPDAAPLRVTSPATTNAISEVSPQ